MSAKIKRLVIEETFTWDKEKYGDYKCDICMTNGEESQIAIKLDKEHTEEVIKVCADVISKALTLKSEQLKADLLKCVNKSLVLECGKEDQGGE